MSVKLKHPNHAMKEKNRVGRFFVVLMSGLLRILSDELPFLC